MIAVMPQQPLEYAADKKRPTPPVRRIGALLIVGAVLCVAAFVIGFIIIVIYVGGG
jgi:hypothetical protein